MAPQGVRVFAINGRPFLFRGGGFSADLFLRYSSTDIANQVGLIRDLGLNGIRTEGKEMPADFYDQMDRAGILIDAGFQCCDAWQPDGGGQGVTAQDYQVMFQSSLTIGRRLRETCQGLRSHAVMGITAFRTIQNDSERFRTFRLARQREVFDCRPDGPSTRSFQAALRPV